MKVLIIYAHPKSNGFSSCFLKETKIFLGSRNIEFEVIDLYEINYDPVMKLDELYTAGNRNISLQNQEFQKK